MKAGRNHDGGRGQKWCGKGTVPSIRYPRGISNTSDPQPITTSGTCVAASRHQAACGAGGLPRQPTRTNSAMRASALPASAELELELWPGSRCSRCPIHEAERQAASAACHAPWRFGPGLVASGVNFPTGLSGEAVPPNPALRGNSDEVPSCFGTGNGGGVRLGHGCREEQRRSALAKSSKQSLSAYRVGPECASCSLLCLPPQHVHLGLGLASGLPSHGRCYLRDCPSPGPTSGRLVRLGGSTRTTALRRNCLSADRCRPPHRRATSV